MLMVDYGRGGCLAVDYVIKLFHFYPIENNTNSTIVI